MKRKDISSNFSDPFRNSFQNQAVTTKPISGVSDYFDLAFQITSRDSGPHELGFTAPDEVFPVCSPDYLLGQALPLSLSELPKQHLLHHRAYPQDWIDWDDWLEQLGLPDRIGYKGTVYDNYLMMIQGAIEGHGITLGWKLTTEDLLRACL